MRTLTVFLYFLLAIVIFASIGVTLPYFFESLKDGKHSIEGLNQNIVTYFVAIFVSASLDYILRLIDDRESYRKPLILLVCIGNVIMFTMTGFILYNNSLGNITRVSSWAILGIILSYVMWWIANFKNSSFDVASSLGGNANNPLNHG